MMIDEIHRAWTLGDGVFCEEEKRDERGEMRDERGERREERGEERWEKREEVQKSTL